MLIVPEIKALSFMEPWLTLMLKGIKTIENRGWYTAYRGKLLLHASKTFDHEVLEMLDAPHNRLPFPKDLDRDPQAYKRGGFVGTCDLVRVMTSSRDPWFVGKYGFELKNFRPLEAPGGFYAYAGQRMLFNVPEDHLRKMGIQIAKGQVAPTGQRTLF